MTAATQNVFNPTYEIASLPIPVLGGVHIYQGTLVNVDANGLAQPAANTSGEKYMGIAMQEVDATAAADSAMTVNVQLARFVGVLFANPTQALVGDIITIADDQTGGTGGNVVLGTCVQVMNTGNPGLIVVDTLRPALS